MLFGQRHQIIEVDGVASSDAAFVAKFGGVFFIAQDFEFPRLSGEAGFDEFFFRQRIGQWFTALDGAEHCLRGEVAHGFDSVCEFAQREGGQRRWF